MKITKLTTILYSSLASLTFGALPTFEQAYQMGKDYELMMLINNAHGMSEAT